MACYQTLERERGRADTGTQIDKKMEAKNYGIQTYKKTEKLSLQTLTFVPLGFKEADTHKYSAIRIFCHTKQSFYT